jgi:copper chaperone CopZ
MVRLGRARVLFFSADRSSRVVGATAHHLLEIDEAQDVSREKFTKEFRPMGSSTNVTTVLYGTTWDDRTLLEEAKQTHLEMERADGVQRAEADHRSGSVVVEVDDPKIVREAVRGLIERAGFEVAG